MMVARDGVDLFARLKRKKLLKTRQAETPETPESRNFVSIVCPTLAARFGTIFLFAISLLL